MSNVTNANINNESFIINWVPSGTSGQAGNVNINADALLVKDGARVSVETFGQGKGGSLTVDAQDVQLIGTTKDGRFASGLFASAGANSTGDAGI
jgi:large exoprotein involved in heme utilization and adhesion